MMETELTPPSTSSSSENSPTSSPLVWSLAHQDENEFGDAVEDRAVRRFALIDGDSDGDSDSDFGGEEQRLDSHGSSSPSIGKALVMIMAKQIAFALAVEHIGPKLGSILYHHQCNAVGGLSERPPPFSFDDYGNLVLEEHLNHPQVSSSAVSGTYLCVGRME